MSNPLILHIETATKVCSVALSKGDELIALKESDRDRSHATLLTSFIRECFAETGHETDALNAVCVSKGPGSYTGLRIGVSTTKGIAYANNIPVISVGTLETLTKGSLEREEIKEHLSQSKEDLLLCPMLDARRMEVYSAFYKPNGEMFREIKAEIIDENSFSDLLDKFRICFFGDGSDKCKSIIDHPNAFFIDQVNPSARHMITLALDAFQKKRFEDVAYFEPFYLKEFIATVPRKKVF